MKKIILLYLMAFTIPLFLGLYVWQSVRYDALEKELVRLQEVQEEWVESNKRLVAGIAEYSSLERIEMIAKGQLELKKMQPENMLQVKITGGKGSDH